MNFTEILDSLENLAEVSGKNEKKVLLDSYLENKNFRTVCLLTLGKQFTFQMSKLPTPSVTLFRNKVTPTIEDVFVSLFAIAQLSGLSNDGKQKFSDQISNIGKDAMNVVTRIVKKDLRCGVKEGLINDVRSGTVPVWPYMRCRSFTQSNLKKINWPAIAQIKANGLHIDIIRENEEIRFMSRTGNEFNFLGNLEKEGHDLFCHNNIPAGEGVFIGEGLVLGPNKGDVILPRKTGNGIISKALKGTITKDEASRIRVQLWEYVDLDDFFNDDSDLEYEDSLEIVEECCENNPKFRTIDYEISNNLEEATAYYRKAKEQDLEGLVIKNFKGTFFQTNTGSPNQMKFKAIEGEEFEIEVRITGINPGKEGTRFQFGVGSFSYLSECGKIVGNVGSGLSHHQRDTLTENDVLDTIWTVRFDELIQDKNTLDIYSLYAPRVIEERLDKTVADTLEYCLELTGG